MLPLPRSPRRCRPGFLAQRSTGALLLCSQQSCRVEGASDGGTWTSAGSQPTSASLQNATRATARRADLRTLTRRGLARRLRRAFDDAPSEGGDAILEGEVCPSPAGGGGWDAGRDTPLRGAG
jgi:hypothetical protein